MFPISQGETVANKRKVPFLMYDTTDQPSLGLSFSSSDIIVYKADGTSANFLGTVAELAGGVYTYTFTTTEVNTVGILLVKIAKANYKTHWVWVRVDPKNPFEVVTVDNSGADATASSFKLASGINGSADAFYPGSVLAFRSGNLTPIARRITTFTTSSRQVTFANAFPAAPANGDEAIIIGRID